MSNTLTLEINSRSKSVAHEARGSNLSDGKSVLMITPPIDEDFWFYRVKVQESPEQAIVAFPKFGTIGIGFQHEEDWNTNLPHAEKAEDIFDHISHNSLGADPNVCIAAIRLVQEAIGANVALRS